MTTLKIRAATPDDAEALLKIYTPYVINTAITFEYEPPTKEEFAERIRGTLEKYPYLAAEEDSGIIGYAYAGAFHKRAAYGWAVENSIYIRQDAHGRGVGKALYERLESALKLMGIINLYASIAYISSEDEHLTNGSVRFHERMGYKLTGKFTKCGYKFSRWYDTVYMEKIIGVHSDSQAPVKRFDEIRAELGL